MLPGDLHSALLEAGEIKDPYFGLAENEAQWIGKRAWFFERKFKVEKDLFNRQSVYLNIDWVDTFATVYVNGKNVLSTSNMFKRYRVDIKDALVLGENDIRIRIDSAEQVALDKAGEMLYEIPWAKGNNKIPHLNMVRKVQCHGGWDWGICLMVLGIYGDISLRANDGFRIEHVYTSQEHQANQCHVTVQVEIESEIDASRVICFELDEKQINVAADLSVGLNVIETTIVIDNPKLWWPAGYGHQPLYELSVSAGDDRVDKKIGLRKVDWALRKDHIGRSMTLRVNDCDIFCKGANWIPVDAMPGRHTDNVYTDLLEDAVAANMNMIRVWGGGQYEHDLFYEKCDELGLLVWQDMMFSCSLYPASDEFLAEIEEEAEYQIKRLRDYASIVLWCGDNELIGFLNGIFDLEEGKRDLFLVQYDRLNRVLRRTIEACDDTRLFWPSSPCNGPDDFGDAWHDDSCGDMHFWNVWHEGKSFEEYYRVVPRFCSEFGYQSLNSMSVVETYADKDQWNVTSPVLEHHQRNGTGGGNGKIIEMMTRYFRMPISFESQLYLSQVQQAMAIKTAVEYWRHMQPICMGTLYWQLNDNWPVASWSSIEYGGKWKQLHYHAKRFFAPVLISAFQKDEDHVEIWVMKDTPGKIDCVAEMTVYDFEGNEQCQITKEIQIGGIKCDDRSLQVADLGIKRLLNDPQDGFLHMRLYEENGRGVERSLIHENTHFFSKFKECDLPEVKVEAVVKDCNGEIGIELKADHPAFFVHLDTGPLKGSFEDSSFTLLPDRKRLVFFNTREKVSVSDMQKYLRVMHLRDTY
nr:glycoside hydrolase family 2 protein [Poriferisphaera corsica]